MTDGQLLNLAAKAAGAKWTDYSDRTPDHWEIKHADGVWRPWAPLADDGDALRLAVKCFIRFGVGSETGRMRVAWFIGTELHELDMPENSPFALHPTNIEWTRFAIVCAAAKIGSGM